MTNATNAPRGGLRALGRAFLNRLRGDEVACPTCIDGGWAVGFRDGAPRAWPCHTCGRRRKVRLTAADLERLRKERAEAEEAYEAGRCAKAANSDERRPN